MTANAKSTQASTSDSIVGALAAERSHRHTSTPRSPRPCAILETVTALPRTAGGPNGVSSARRKGIGREDTGDAALRKDYPANWHANPSHEAWRLHIMYGDA